MFRMYDSADEYLGTCNILKRKEEVLILQTVDVENQPALEKTKTINLFTTDLKKGVTGCKKYSYDASEKLLVVMLTGNDNTYGENKRQHIRIPMEVVTEMHFFEEGSLVDVECFIHNVSVGGLQFSVAAANLNKIHVGDEVTFKLETYFGNAVEGVVKWYRLDTTGNVRMGVEFQNLTTKAKSSLFNYVSQSIKKVK